MSGLKSFRLVSLLVVLLLAAQRHAYCQDTEATEKAKADQLFDAEKYVEATPLYLKLLALNPRSTDYNYHYGTCLLYNSYKKQDAFKYLNYAVTDPAIDIQAYYFLGKAYHLNYQFNEAIKNYELYKQKAAGKPKVSFEVDRQIEMCQNGKRLLTTITDLIVLEKKEYDADKFFRLYNLQDIGGDLIVAADYQSKIDKKKGHVPLIHFPANSSSIYYASYGDSDTGQKDIYVRKKLPDGTWGLPQPVGGNVNTKSDEDFPYMHPGGEYLYFCSKGHNSMGGYDIFRSKLNAETNTFGPPENMDFAVSSPDNDLFYIVDSLDKNAYFASSRQSANGKMHVYKVRVDRVPLQLAVVKGNFASTIHPENKKITITVTDFASGDAIGTFASNEKGSYLITFPKGGKYTYEMKVEGSPVSHKYVVTIPFMKEFKPLKQKIQEEMLESDEVVKVVDQFNEAVEDPLGVLAEVIKLRSELNPNANQFNLEQLDAGRENQKILAELGFGNATPGEIVSTFEALENQQEQKVKQNDNLVNGALTQAVKQLDEAAKKQEEAKNLVNRSASAPTKEQKYALLTEAQEKMSQAGDSKDIAKKLISFADSVAKKGQAGRELLASIEAVTAEIKKDVAEDNAAGLKDVITGNATTIEAVKQGGKDPVTALIDERMAVQKEKAGYQKQLSSYTQTEEQLNAEIKTLQESLPNAKAKDRPGIETAIASKTGERDMVTQEKQHLERKIEKATKKEDALNEQIGFLQSVTQVNGNPVAPAEVQNKLAQVDTKNSNTLAAYVNQQVAELKKDPEIAQMASSQDKDPVVEMLEDTYDDRVASINNAGFGSPGDKAKQLLDAEEELAGRIDDEIEKVDNALQQNPTDQQAQERKKELTGMKAETEKRIGDRKAEIAQLNENPVAVETTPGNELAILVPDYEEQLDNAGGNTPKERLEAQNRVDADVIAKVDAELAKVNADLQQNPTNKSAQNRKTALTTLKTQAQDRITDRKDAIAQLNETPVSTDITPEKELAAILPDYEEQLDKAGGNTPKERLAAQNRVDEVVIAKVDAELAKVNAELQQNPTDKTARDRRAALNTLKMQAQDRITDRKDAIAQLNETPVSVETTPEKELAAIVPDYEEQLDNAGGNTPKERLAAQNRVDEAVIEKVDAELLNVERDLEENPANTAAQKRKDALNALKAQTEERIGDRNDEIAAIRETPATSEITPESELTALAPGHERMLEDAGGDTPVERLEAKNAVDQRLLDQVNSELEDVEGQLLRNPDNQEAQQRQEALTTLKEQVESRIGERKTAIADAQSAPTGNQLTETAERLRPEYRENIGKIEAVMDPGMKKDLAILKEERGLLDAIAQEIAKKETELQKNPANTRLLNELDQLREVQAMQEEKVNENELDLIAIEVAQIDPERLQASIAPDFQAPDMENRESYTEEQIAAFEANEKKLQGKLAARLNANEKKLLKGFDPKIAAENKVIVALMDQSGERMSQLSDPVVVDDGIAEKIASDLGEDNAVLMQSKPASIDEAKRIITELKEYEGQLSEQLNDLESAEPTDEAAVTEKKQQLSVVRKRIGVVEAELDDMESFLQTASGDPNRTQAEKELAGLTSQEREMQARIDNGNLTPQERRAVEKEMAVVRDQKEQQETIVLQETLAAAQNDRREAAATLTAEAGDPVVKAALDRSSALTQPAGEKPTKRQIAEQVNNEEQAAALLEATQAYVATQSVFDDKQLVTATPASLEAQKRRFLIEIGQMEAQMEQLKNDPAQTATYNELSAQKRALETAVERIDRMQGQLAAEKTVDNPVRKGLESEVSYAQENELASDPAYPQLLEQYRGTQSTQRQLNDVAKEKTLVREQLSETANPAERAKLTDRLEALTADEKALRSELEQQQRVLQTNIDATGKPEQYTNLLAREVTPVKAAPVGRELVPALADGFEIVQTPAATRVEKSIPVDLKSPSGLVYRVQVGAFAKPIPEDLFKEFTPVTGEKLNNGITRYLAGYFGNRDKVLEAQRQIRGLGYADAFVVAYCDGNRITLAEARRLEDLGLCVPKNQDSILLEVVESRLAALPSDSLERLRPVVKPNDYNKAPGAAVAEVAEERRGLYYTVQVGVYNRPVPASQVKDISPLITKRLPNGQIRYSSGIFRSVAEARPKRAEAVARGISDAYITAYYNGERISLEEAKRILAEQGEQVLEQQNTPIAPDAIDAAKAYAATQPKAKPAPPSVQFVSKERYEDYPREEIARLNNHGSFYYDAADKRIKSVEYVSEEAAGRLEALVKDLDTVQLAQENDPTVERKPSTIVAVWESSEMTGETADWLLRLTVPHAGTATGSGFRLSFDGIPSDEQTDWMRLLESYGASQVKLEEENRQ